MPEEDSGRTQSVIPLTKKKPSPLPRLGEHTKRGESSDDESSSDESVKNENANDMIPVDTSSEEDSEKTQLSNSSVRKIPPLATVNNFRRNQDPVEEVSRRKRYQESTDENDSHGNDTHERPHKRPSRATQSPPTETRMMETRDPCASKQKGSSREHSVEKDYSEIRPDIFMTATRRFASKLLAHPTLKTLSKFPLKKVVSAGPKIEEICVGIDKFGVLDPSPLKKTFYDFSEHVQGYFGKNLKDACTVEDHPLLISKVQDQVRASENQESTLSEEIESLHRRSSDIDVEIEKLRKEQAEINSSISNKKNVWSETKSMTLKLKDELSKLHNIRLAKQNLTLTSNLAPA